MREQQKLTDQQVQKLEKQVAVLVENLKGFHRATWYRTAATKLFSMVTAVASSPEGRKLLSQAAQKAIGVDTPHDA